MALAFFDTHSCNTAHATELGALAAVSAHTSHADIAEAVWKARI